MSPFEPFDGHVSNSLVCCLFVVTGVWRNQ